VVSRLAILAALTMLAAGCAPAPTAAPAPTPAAPRLGAVPDLRGATAAEAANALAAAGLVLGQAHSSCAAIAGAPAPQPGPLGSVLCQSIPPGSMVPAGLAVDYVLYAGLQ
jgi:beta-lactam-binding protein with PASTA domain